MKVLITGKGGQLAWELERTAPKNIELIVLGRCDLDISDESEVNTKLQEFKPDLVINAAAYTAVDKAESEKEIAFSVNANGVENLSNACKVSNVRLIHVSTDFVFDGLKSTPYQINDIPNPLSVYGASKLEGELAVKRIIPNNSVIVRTSWVYSSYGHNFVKSMLSLMATKDSLGVVGDQIGTPTWAKGLALWIWDISTNKDVSGVFHWTDAGVASWYDFAVAIQEIALQKELLEKEIIINSIPSTEYRTPAKRPTFSVMDKIDTLKRTDLQSIHWRKQLSSMLDELINEK